MGADCEDAPSEVASVAEQVAEERSGSPASTSGSPRMAPVKTSVERGDLRRRRVGGLTRSATADGDMSLHATRGASSDKAKPRDLRVWDYCCAELGLSVGKREDDPDMAVARERVFDIIWYIPLEFERLNFYGGMLCADAVLGVVTSLPVRVVCQTARVMFAPWAAVLPSLGLTPSKASARGARQEEGKNSGSHHGGGAAAVRLASGTATSKRVSWGFHPYAREHLSDSLWLLMLVAAVAATGSVDVSMLYHYIRGQEVIKLYLACSVLECFDKLCCAFNCHVLDALQNSVYIVVNTAATGGSHAELTYAAAQLGFDAALTMAVTVSHTMIMLTHAVTLSVAINSHTNAMLLVLISNNFGEIKGHVFKKMDETKVFTAARMDIVERVHLSICLLFVAAQRVTAAGSLAGGLTRKMLKDSMMVLGSEIGVDVFKHAFMSKFNALRPKVYRGFFRQLCREHVKLAQSYKLHRVVGFVPLAPAAVLIRSSPDSTARSLPEEIFPAPEEVSAEAGGASNPSSPPRTPPPPSSPAAVVAARWSVGGDEIFAWLDTLRVEFGSSMPHPGELLGFALAFVALVACKLAFGIALHWFGARMLETLPKRHRRSERSADVAQIRRGRGARARAGTGRGAKGRIRGVTRTDARYFTAKPAGRNPGAGRRRRRRVEDGIGDRESKTRRRREDSRQGNDRGESAHESALQALPGLSRGGVGAARRARERTYRVSRCVVARFTEEKNRVAAAARREALIYLTACRRSPETPLPTSAN